MAKRTWIAFFSILKKDIKKYYLKLPNISWGLIFPLSWTLMQIIQSDGGADIRQLLPGLIGMSVLFSATSMLAVTITFERKGRSFDRLLFAPISLNVLVVAKILGAILFGVIGGAFPIIIAAFFTNLSGINWGFVVFGIILIATTSALIGLLIAVSAKEIFEAQAISNFFRFPMLFLCALFYPLTALPVFIRPLAHCFPLTYGVDIMKIAINDLGAMAIWLNILVMIIFALGLYLICRLCIKKKWIN